MVSIEVESGSGQVNKRHDCPVLARLQCASCSEIYQSLFGRASVGSGLLQFIPNLNMTLDGNELQ
jgi:hypothetical protein